MAHLQNIFLLPVAFLKTREKIFIAILIFVGSLCMSYQLLKNSLDSKWSVVDDREIAFFLGSDHRVGIAEAWKIYTEDTEIGKYGLFGRFRPSYHAFRLLESVIFNDELILWYVSNIIIFAFFMAVFWLLIAELVGVVVAGLIVFYTATTLYWIDVFGRLGPSEPFVILGLCLAVIGGYLIYKYELRRWGWFFLNFGLMICTGAKENTLLFLIPYALICWDQYKRHHLDFLDRTLLLLTILWNGWIVSAILIALSNHGTDVYQRSIFDKFSSLSNVLFRGEVIALYFVCILFFGVFFVYRTRSSNEHRLAFTYGCAVAFLLVFYVFQFFYYTGDFPNGDRYDVPGLLVWPIVSALVLSFFYKLFHLYAKKRAASILVLVAVLGFLVVPNRFQNIQVVHKEILKYVKFEKRFTRDVQKLALQAKSHPDSAIIFQVNHPLEDYDIIQSYNQFLRYYNAVNPIAIFLAGDAISKTDTILYPYFRDLIALSNGGEAALPGFPMGGDFVPLRSVESIYKQKCILVLFSGMVPEKDCPIVYKIQN